MSGKECKDILDWELSLDSRDLRAHAWYHGNINRQMAEVHLKVDGEFLVRDCSSSGRVGDFVLSCRWENTNLHFMIHKDILQKDTIYEQLRYRFESDSFDTVPDLITYHVGSGMSISEKSGAKIISPRNRTLPLSGNTEIGISNWCNSEYSILAKDWTPQFIEASLVSKSSTLERSKPPSINLNPKVDTSLEELEEIPLKIKELMSKAEKNNIDMKKFKESNYDLNNFASILLPANAQACLDASLLQVIISRLLEASDKSVASHLTKIDWEIFAGEIELETLGERNQSEILKIEKIEIEEESKGLEKVQESQDFNEENENNKNKESLSETKYKIAGIYDRIFHDSQYRWNNVIERSLTLTHFVFVTTLRAEKPEEILSKWIRVAQTLKTSMGNLFSFSAIMRGLMMRKVTDPTGKINWFLLRSDFTEATFSFETTFRKAYHGFESGLEDYPPNTTIPNFFPVALILEDKMEFLYQSGPTSEEETLHFIHRHMNSTKSLSTWSSVQQRNMERHLCEDQLISDIVLQDIFRTEFQLCFLWGEYYGSKESTLKLRCDTLDTLV